MGLISPAGYFVYQVKQKAKKILESIHKDTGKQYNIETDGLRIYTTLNEHIQKLAREAVKTTVCHAAKT